MGNFFVTYKWFQFSVLLPVATTSSTDYTWQFNRYWYPPFYFWQKVSSHKDVLSPPHFPILEHYL